MPRRKSNQQTELVAFALRGIDAQIAKLEQTRAELLGQTNARVASTAASTESTSTQAAKPRKRKKFSAEHIAKLREAAQRRWGKGKKRQAAVKRPQATAKKAVPNKS